VSNDGYLPLILLSNLSPKNPSSGFNFTSSATTLGELSYLNTTLYNPYIFSKKRTNLVHSHFRSNSYKLYKIKGTVGLRSLPQRRLRLKLLKKSRAGKPIHKRFVSGDKLYKRFKKLRSIVSTPLIKINTLRLVPFLSSKYSSSNLNLPILREDCRRNDPAIQGSSNLPVVMLNSSSTSSITKIHNKLRIGCIYDSNMYPSPNIATSISTFKPASTRDLNFYPDIAPWLNDSFVRLIESCSGKRAIMQHSMNVEHMVGLSSKISYRK
jgi:hypothetical protein